MSKSRIFENWAQIYYENGIPVIPLEPKGKRVFIKEWTTFCSNFPEQSDINSWTVSNPEGNIGMPLGRAANMIALDIDTDDEDVIAMLPKSPCVKRGQKGETRFFRYSDETIVREFNIGKKCFCEVLSTGRQTVLPPSIHPNIMPDGKRNYIYTWLSDLKLTSIDFHPTLLPVLGNDWHEPLIELINSKYSNSIQAINSVQQEEGELTEGRNNKLKSIVSAMIIKWKTPEEIKQQIYDYDRENHIPRLFLDETEGFKGKSEEDAFNNAGRFYFNIFSSFMRDPNKAKLIEQPTANIHVSLTPKEAKEEATYDPNDIPEFPKLGNSYIDLFVEYCDNISNHNIKPIALGGALSLMSILAANKVRGQFAQFDVRPNIYAFSLAPSGTGKSIPQDAIKQLLIGKECLKSSAFKSAASLIETLPNQQEQLVLVDEASHLLRSISSPLAHQADISNAIREIYSCATSFYGGISSRASGQAFGACYNPSLSILASSTCNEFDALINETVSEGGFLPRFLFFRQNSRGAIKDVNYNADACKVAFEELQRFVFDMNAIKPNYIGGSEKDKSKFGYRYNPMCLQLSPSGLELYKDIMNRTLSEVDDGESPYKARKVEHICKISLLAAVSRRSHVITDKEIAWAEKVWDLQHDFSIKKIQLSYAPNDFFRYMIMVKEIVAKNVAKGKEKMTKANFNVVLGNLKAKTPMTPIMKRMIIAELVDTGLIIDKGREIIFNK